MAGAGALEQHESGQAAHALGGVERRHPIERWQALEDDAASDGCPDVESHRRMMRHHGQVSHQTIPSHEQVALDGHRPGRSRVDADALQRALRRRRRAGLERHRPVRGAGGRRRRRPHPDRGVLRLRPGSERLHLPPGLDHQADRGHGRAPAGRAWSTRPLGAGPAVPAGVRAEPIGAGHARR